MTIMTATIFHTRQRLSKAAAITTLLLLGSCGTTPPSNFYTLNAVTDAPAVATAGGCLNLDVAIGPILFPEYLRRPNIVTRTSPNKLIIDEFNRWGGSLQEDFERLFRVQLATALNSKKVFPYPNNETAAADYSVSVNVHRLDGRFGDSARLVGEWSLIDMATRSVIISDYVSFTESLPGNDYEQLADAYSRLVTDFSNMVATVLVKHCGT